MLVAFGLAVHCHLRCGAVVPEQKPLDGNGGVVDRLVRGGSDLVSHLTAVPVNTVPDAVDEVPGHAVDMNHRQILHVRVEQKGLVGREFPLLVTVQQVVKEVVAASRGKVVDIPARISASQGIDEPIDGAVSAGQDYGHIGG